MDSIESAASNFKEGFNCAQSVFCAFAVNLGLDRETALKLATPFGGGIAGTAQMCGAVSGAIMAIGLKLGTASADKPARAKSYAAAKKFMELFKGRQGSLVCREILGCDIGTPEGMKTAQDKKLFDKTCAKAVKDAAAILNEVLEQP
jgi:C_GCAxxG_C_C family probable redox protein